MQDVEIVIDGHFPALNPVQFGCEECEPGHSFGPAVRTHWLLHYVACGCGIFVYRGKTWNVSAGEIFVIPPYEETYYEADRNDPWQYIWIGFEIAYLPVRSLPPVIREPWAKRLFSEMLFCKSMENGKSAYLAGKIWELFSLLLEKEQQRPVSYADKAISQMQAEYMRPLRISALAQQLHIDRSYFSVVFRRATGMSPQQYLTALRLQKAAELMTQFAQTPSKAAFSVGYSDVYQFSKAFKRHYGVSPSVYQDSYFREGNAEPSCRIKNNGSDAERESYDF